MRNLEMEDFAKERVVALLQELLEEAETQVHDSERYTKEKQEEMLDLVRKDPELVRAAACFHILCEVFDRVPLKHRKRVLLSLLKGYRVA